MKKTTLNEKNRVIIRIWPSILHASHPADDVDVGHISVQIEGKLMKNPYYNAQLPDSQEYIPFYVSLWPQRMLPDAIKIRADHGNRTGIFFHEPHQFLLSPEQDYQAEGGPPKILFCLYSLDNDAMYDYFESMKNTNQINGWVLFGGNIISAQAHSCATLAARILKAGDINNYIVTGSIASITNPDQLSVALARAKQKELENFPETKDFQLFPDETDVIKHQVSTCNII
ncbi:MAG: hypothetical protein K2Q14_07090 [Gammaproteobacteria bacterium]|nr:hypothetical protein [Gammaproteobacteria bacterium]